MKHIVLFDDGYCQIPVTYKGHISWLKVDDDVALWASKHSWCLRGRTSAYAVSKIQGKIKQLHALINYTPEGLDTDHINGRTLDNRRTNLRSVSRSINSLNRHNLQPKASQWRGVYWKERDQVWFASLNVRGRTVHAGTFHSEIDAAQAYNIAAYRFHGPSAFQNQPKSTTP